MSLSKILEEIKELKPFAVEDVEEGPSTTLSARRGRKKQSQDRLQALTEEYFRTLMNGSLFILVTGADRNEFSSLASEKYGCFSADSDGFYKSLVDKVSPVLYEGKESSSSTFGVLERYLEDMAMNMGVLEYPQLIFQHKYKRMINSKEDFLAVAKQALNEQVGGELAGIYAIRSLVDKAIEKGHSAKVTPVVMNTKEEQLAVDLLPALKRLTPNVFLVIAGKAPRYVKGVSGAITLKDTTPESVQEALTNIKNSIKK